MADEAALIPAASSAKSSITVAIRVRPFTIQEASQLRRTDDGPLFLGDGSLASNPKPQLKQSGIRNIIKIVDEKCLVFDPPEDNPVQRFSRSVMPMGKRVKDQTFAFDRVFDENTAQADVYEATTRPLLRSVLDGYNATVFAYGATGCGKTHTITGTSSQPGIIFLTMQELFEMLAERQETHACETTLSFLEIYNETIRDLLSEEESPKGGLMLREDNNEAVSVAGLTSHKPQSVQEVMDMVIRGNTRRTQSPTEANATSSRSHAVLQVNIAMKDRNASVSEPTTFATLSIIDLAGSERASATKNRGARLQEGANINKSLLALGSCINALCERRRNSHVPFRNSKLTRLLKFSLGGNCKTVMIVCISPSSVHFDETQNTLRYANRAKNIQTKSVRNVMDVNRHVKDYVMKIDEQMALINQLNAQIKEFEKHAFAKFRKAESKRTEVAREGVQRIRAAYEHSSEERKERITCTLRLKQLERRISAIGSWIAAFDEMCEAREDEEAPVSLTAMRKTASGIDSELQNSRLHFHQRLGKNNWTRAIDTALQDGVRQLQGLDGYIPDSMEENNLRKEVELLKHRADIDMHLAVLEQERGGEAGLLQVMLSAHFETITILGQIMQMSEEEAVQAARQVLGKVLTCCTEATGQVIKPDGGLQITEAVPPSRAGTPRKKRQVPIMGPRSTVSSMRASTSGISGQDEQQAFPVLPPPPPSPYVGSSPIRGAAASPRRRVKLGGMARKGVAFGGTPRKRSPTKKRAVKWKDEDTEGGSLVEYQSTPKVMNSSPPISYESQADSDHSNDAPKLHPAFESLNINGDVSSSPLPVAPVVNGDIPKPGNGRFAAGFLSKKHDVSPSMPPPSSLTLGNFSSEDENSPLREMHANSAPRRSMFNRRDSSLGHKEQRDEGYTSSSDVEKSFSDKEAAQEIRDALHTHRRSSVHKRSSSLGSVTAARVSNKVESAHRRRSPTASSPPSDSGPYSAVHARRFLSSNRDESHRNSILSPRTQPVSKGAAGNIPMSARRSMFDLSGNAGTPRASTGSAGRSHSRSSSLVPGSAGRSSTGGKAVWR